MSTGAPKLKVAEKSSATIGYDWRATWKLRFFGLFKVPMIWFAWPYVSHLDLEKCGIVIPLRRRVKNHYGSLYFGALAIGADAAAGLLAMHHISQTSTKVGLLFKNFTADFQRRAMGDVVFHCNAGEAIAQLVAQTLRTKQRCESPIPVVASSLKGEDAGMVVAQFTLTLSLKAF